jgi:ribonuclease P protein component
LDETAGRAAAECPNWGRLTRRAEFQRTARGRRAQLEAFALQANRRLESPALVGPRVGFTVTKKIGNAVVRNRIRRRLREALRRISCLEALPDHDYVLMARLPALTMDFEALVGEIDRGFRQLRRDRPRSGPRARDRDRRS